MSKVATFNPVVNLKPHTELETAVLLHFIYCAPIAIFFVTERNKYVQFEMNVQF